MAKLTEVEEDRELSDGTAYNDVFAFLDALKESGQCNMFGAAPHVQESFGIDKREAKKVTMAWMAK